MSLTIEREKIIKNIDRIDKSVRGELKKLIQTLAANLAQGIKEQKIDVLNQLKLVGAEDERGISKIIKRIKEKNGWQFSDSTIEKALPSNYKTDTKPETGDLPQITLTNEYLERNEELIKRRLSELHREKSKDIKTKDSKKDIETYKWECWYAEELAKIALKLENEHKEHHDKSLCSEYAKRAKTARDGRFATSLNNYEAIIVACNAVTSLKNAVSGEVTYLNRWDVYDNEKGCRECLNMDECKRSKCTHVCHDWKKIMTTKGLKFALKENPHLKELDEHMKKLMVWGNDICSFAKILLRNMKTDEYLNKADKKAIMARHIDKDDCIQCEDFLSEHPEFFQK